MKNWIMVFSNRSSMAKTWNNVHRKLTVRQNKSMNGKIFQLCIPFVFWRKCIRFGERTNQRQLVHKTAIN